MRVEGVTDSGSSSRRQCCESVPCSRRRAPEGRGRPVRPRYCVYPGRASARPRQSPRRSSTADRRMACAVARSARQGHRSRFVLISAALSAWSRVLRFVRPCPASIPPPRSGSNHAISWSDRNGGPVVGMRGWLTPLLRRISALPAGSLAFTTGPLRLAWKQVVETIEV